MWVVDADFAIAASDAQFIDPHTSIGQTVGRGTIGLTGPVPFGDAMRLALGGRHERMSAARALEVGLVTEGRGPTGAVARSGARDRGEDRSELTGCARILQACNVAVLANSASTMPAVPHQPTSSRCGPTLTKPRAPQPSPRNANPTGTHRSGAQRCSSTGANDEVGQPFSCLWPAQRWVRSATASPNRESGIAPVMVRRLAASPQFSAPVVKHVLTLRVVLSCAWSGGG